MPFLVDLTTVMEDYTVATLGDDLYRNSKASPPMLASGRATLSIFETSGGAPERTQNSVIIPGYLHVSAQFVAESHDPEQAYAMALNAWNGLVGIRNSWISNSLASGWYREINCTQMPFDAGLNDRGQARFVFNVTAVKRP